VLSPAPTPEDDANRDGEKEVKLRLEIEASHSLTEALTTRKKDAEEEVRAQAKQLAAQEREARDQRLARSVETS
jgi:hypothetical protein